ncbi:MAG: SEC-C metal-binding domain-containing protein, partial [Spirochaetaceae bacterium]|nr:SEC-C metal-binding domain-containing protein [Spirochaetaceae bacterium]
RAQRRVEERNFETRKHLLDFDNVLNEQRKFIYGKRDEIMASGRLVERVVDTAVDELTELVEECSNEHGAGGDWHTVLANLKTRYFLTPELPAAHYEKLPRQELEQALAGELRRALEAKQAQIGREPFNLFIRYEYLRAIDSRWQDHLENLSALQEAVRLRAYSQKNPLLEYKLEGFQIFDRMLDEIRVAIAEKIFKVTIRHSERQPARRGAMSTARHVSIGQFAAGAGAAPAQSGNGTAPNVTAAAGVAAARSALGRRAAAVQNVTGTVQAQRAVPKVGRNAPCPCGSGKKYKHCHGT